jgi:chromosome segregation ATPase
MAILSVFGSLNRRWVRQEQAQLQHLKAKLDPWSQTKILETIDHENKTLGDLEAEIESVEELIAQAVKHGVAERPEVDRCYDELNGLKQQINNQRQKLYQIETYETAQKVDAWLYRIEDIEAFLQSDRPADDIPEFLNRIEAEQQAIERDPTFQNFQSLVATNAQIGQTIDQVKLRIKRRLVIILIEDVGRRDEEIARLRDELAEAQVEVAGARMKIAQAKLHEIDRYIIPLALIATFIAGGLLAPQLEAALPGLPILRWIALFLLIVYFGYYAWSYYVSPSSDE